MASLRHARRVATAAGIACLAAFGAGCASAGGSSAGPTVTVTATPAASQTSGTASPPVPNATVTVTPATRSPAPPAIPAGVTLCATSGLKITLGLSQGAAGHVYQVIDFTNISGGTCVLYGYPGVSLAGGNPVTQIGRAAREDPSTPRQLVTLAPGAVGNALLTITEAYASNTCHPEQADYLQIYPPNQTTPAYLGYLTKTCSGPVQTLRIAATRPGSGGG